jgi:hypothetical protein
MNGLAISVAIILLPGLMAAVICDKITVHNPRWDYFKYAVYSYLFGVVSYSLLQVGYWSIDFINNFCFCEDVSFLPLKTWSIITDSEAKVDLKEIALAVFFTSPVVAFLASTLVNRKLITNLASKFGVSNKYGDENLFSFFLNSPGIDWVYIREKHKGFTYLGRIASFSENDKFQEIVLSDVEVYDYETSELLYKLEAIYLSNQIGSFVIELPNKV